MGSWYLGLGSTVELQMMIGYKGAAMGLIGEVIVTMEWFG
jgi:hypothetical protein